MTSDHGAKGATQIDIVRGSIAIFGAAINPHCIRVRTLH
jgi:hypothetical protein